MTTHEIGQRAPSRHARRKRRRNYGPVIILALVCAAMKAKLEQTEEKKAG